MRRTPLQGGLPPSGPVAGPVLEIACDESGFSGTNLLRSDAPVITHASVDLTVDEAATLIASLRLPPHELKSGPFLRRAGDPLPALLTALRGRAHVHLIDKRYFVATRIVDLLLTAPTYAAGTSLTPQHRAVALALLRGGDQFLDAFVDLVRPKRRPPLDVALARLFRLRDSLARAELDGLDPAHVRSIVTRLDNDDRSIPPPLEPLLPALAETVLFWSRGTRPIHVVHDEQSALTADRLTRLQQVLHSAGRPLLTGLTMVDSRDDPRVQLADLLAGIARRRPESVTALSSTTSPAVDLAPR
ncbi:hypothetical protein [Actinoplanes solisilvae]|uniref:hypothetical protein n=1 Tax=Actinoplanes solisilvae TaxID=2486853 RepID=UPI000FDBA9A1|nr:hypothetical protein [Actinoplanes solisilvae]